jgi:hypothetical protein
METLSLTPGRPDERPPISPRASGEGRPPRSCLRSWKAPNPVRVAVESMEDVVNGIMIHCVVETLMSVRSHSAAVILRFLRFDGSLLR